MSFSVMYPRHFFDTTDRLQRRIAWPYSDSWMIWISADVWFLSTGIISMSGLTSGSRFTLIQTSLLMFSKSCNEILGANVSLG